jgi:catechol 2,3-dioxygenase-like lactoylglutathione lyase family enzyme
MGIGVRGLVPLLQVFHMPTAIRFYRDALGFEVTQKSAALSDDTDDVNWVMLQLNDAVVMLNTAYEPEYKPVEPDAARWQGHEDTGLFIGCPDVDTAYEFLKSKGVECKPPHVAWYGMKQLYIRDPDGYVICFQWQARPEEIPARSAESGVQVG